MDFEKLEKAEESSKIHKVADAVVKVARLGGGLGFNRENLILYGIQPKETRDRFKYYRTGNLRNFNNPLSGRTGSLIHPWEKKKRDQNPQRRSSDHPKRRQGD